MTDRLIRPAPVFAALAALLSCLLAGVAAAATPPGLVNYQGSCATPPIDRCRALTT